MSRWGRWGRWPRRWGGGPTLAQAIYGGMRTSRGLGHYSLDDSSIANLELRAYALAAARAQRAQARGALQAFPGKATTSLEGWERRLRLASRDPNETEADRRAMLDAILTGTSVPSAENIVAALKLALAETVTVVAAKRTPKTFRTNATPFTPSLAESPLGLGTGSLRAGAHRLIVAGERDNVVSLNELDATATVTADGKSVIVTPIPLSAFSPAVDVIHYYLSVRAGSSECAYAASGTGGAMEISGYPTSPARPELHHLAIIVSAATFGDTTRRRKIDEILAPMLSSWTTWSVLTTSSPFLLDVTSPPGSGLGVGGF